MRQRQFTELTAIEVELRPRPDGRAGDDADFNWRPYGCTPTSGYEYGAVWIKRIQARSPGSSDGSVGGARSR